MEVGFIGCGNMARAIIGGIVKKMVKPGQVIASDVFEDGLIKAQADLGINIAKSNLEVAEQSPIIFLAVKPNQIAQVSSEIAPQITADKLVISIAAGVSLKALEEYFAKKVKLVRVMPNTPAMVGAGMSAVCLGSLVTDADRARVLELLGGIGLCEIVPESLMSAVVAISGSSPAYIYMLIEAMADAAVLHGMPRAQAYTFASQAVMGSAKMVLESAQHPGALKDMVCSPGGTTIEAVAALEERGFRSAVIEAMRACAAKNKEMGG